MTKLTQQLLICIALGGCASTPNIVEVRNESVYARGSVSGKLGDQLEWITIDLRNSSKDFRDRTWIDIHDGKKTLLSDVSPKLLKDREAKESVYTRADGSVAYSLYGYLFWFAEGRFVELNVNDYGFPSGNRETRPRMGSISSGASLTLPCSLPEFESVFGKSNKIARFFGGH